VSTEKVGMIFYTAYYSTGDDPTQHFSLLQLSGRRLLNEIPIGLIALRHENLPHWSDFS